MNKDDAREAAVKELHTKQFVEGRDLRFFGAGFERGFDAGVASVDRRAIVEEAFEKVRDWTLFKSTDATKAGTQLVGEAMDAVLAEMGGDDE